ncbi:MAG: NADP oxidoreductase, partial [Thermoanaerobaculia bacterium]
MGIPGEDLSGVHSGTEFVGWYNSHPAFRDRSFDLARATRIAVVGNGNVAMDVTRILAKEPEELASSDIADWALEALGRSSVREILLLGRRGPAQAAFSPSEIKEIGSLEAADLVVGSDEVEIDEVTHRWLEKAAKSAHTNVAFLTEQSKKGEGTKKRKIRCKFLVSPVELLGEEGRLRAVRLERNSLFEGEGGTPRPRGTGEFWVEEVQLLFKCVGYRGIPIPGVSFDDRRGIFPNSQGRLMNPDTGKPSPGQYVVGWAKRGPTGLIGTNRPDSAKTVQAMVEDIQGKTAAVSPLKRPEAVLDLLCSRGVDYVTFEDWQGLDQEEVARGKAKGKVRDKFPRIDEMMTVIHRARKQQKSADS